MFVIYRCELQKKDKYVRVQEFKTLEEAEEFIDEHKDDNCLYTVMME